MKVRLLYFAALGQTAGCSEETVSSEASDVAGLYLELAARHGFRFPREQLRVAVNGAFADWARPLADNDEIVFVPPVSGG